MTSNPDSTSLPSKDDSASRKSGGLLRSGAIVGSMTMVSRVLGLVRDVVLARFIGADGLADAFFVAFKIPNFLRRLFAEGAFAQAFVPVLAEYREKGGKDAVKALVDRVAGALGSALILLTAFVVVASPLVAVIFAPGFVGDEVRFEAASQMIRITFPYLLFISLTGFAGGILNSYDRFAIPAITPVWLNVCLIVAAVLGGAWFTEPAYALAWGVFVAGIIQLLFQLPFLFGIGLMPRPRLDLQFDGVRKILRLMGPAIFGVSVSQINLLLDTVIASFLPTGSVSWLYYSDRLSELPLGVFGVALGTVILPSLSRQHASASADRFGHTLDWAVRMVMLVAVPSTVALVILAQPILTTLFYDGGQITLRDITMSTASLIAYACGLSAFMMIKVLAPGFYARQDTRTPVRIGIIAMVSNMVFNIIFVLYCHHYWQMGHVGLAAATSLSAYINAYLLFHRLKKDDVYRPSAGWTWFLVRLLLATGAMAAALLVSCHYLNDWQHWAFHEKALWLSLICLGGASLYGLLLLAMGFRFNDFRPARAVSRPVRPLGD